MSSNSTSKKSNKRAASADAAAEDAEVAVVDKRARALEIMQARFKKAGSTDAKQIKMGSGNDAPKTNITGFVANMTNLIKHGPNGQQLPALRATIVVDSVTIPPGTPDALACGDTVPGFAYILPTINPKPVDVATTTTAADGPEKKAAAAAAAQSRQGYKATAQTKPPRVLSIDSYPKCFMIGGEITVEVFTQKAGGGDIDGLAYIKPGAGVSLQGVAFSTDEKKNSGRYYIDVIRIEPLRNDHIANDEEVNTLIKASMAPNVALTSAVLASQLANGFVGFQAENNAERKAAEFFQESYAKIPIALSEQCAKLAEDYKASHPENVKVIDCLGEHAERIAKISPATIAGGKETIFTPSIPIQPDKPVFSAALCQSGRFPIANAGMPLFMVDISEKRVADYPQTFSEFNVIKCDMQGACANILVSVWYVANVTTASKTIRESEDSVLGTGETTGAMVKANMRVEANGVGTIVKHLCEAVFKSIVEYANTFLLMRVNSKKHNADALISIFPHCLKIDYRDGILKTGLPVSQAFLEEAFGKQFLPEPPDPTVELLKDKEGEVLKITNPTLKLNSYQAISQSGFNFNKIRLPDTKSAVTYRVLFERSVDKVIEFDENVEQSEAYLRKQADDNHADLGEFLTAATVVYAVAI